jgi:hypothetical protein
MQQWRKEFLGDVNEEAFFAMKREERRADRCRRREYVERELVTCRWPDLSMRVEIIIDLVDFDLDYPTISYSLIHSAIA